MNYYPATSAENEAPESILNTENWFNWNVYFHTANDSKDHSVVDVECDMQWPNGIDVPIGPEQLNACDEATVPGLFRPIWKSTKEGLKGFGDKQCNGNNME